MWKEKTETTVHTKNVQRMEGTEINDSYGVKKKVSTKMGKPKNKTMCNTQYNLKTTN
jgi:hypothetical protein